MWYSRRSSSVSSRRRRKRRKRRREGGREDGRGGEGGPTRASKSVDSLIAYLTSVLPAVKTSTNNSFLGAASYHPVPAPAPLPAPAAPFLPFFLDFLPSVTSFLDFLSFLTSFLPSLPSVNAFLHFLHLPFREFLLYRPSFVLLFVLLSINHICPLLLSNLLPFVRPLLFSRS